MLKKRQKTQIIEMLILPRAAIIPSFSVKVVFFKYIIIALLKQTTDLYNISSLVSLF